VPHLAEAGASSITFQIEPFLAAAAAALGPAATPDAVRAKAAAAAAVLAADIRGRGARAGVAAAPGTPVDAVLPLARDGAVDMVGSLRWGKGGWTKAPAANEPARAPAHAEVRHQHRCQRGPLPSAFQQPASAPSPC
jgi:pentose-5-phosphate-3-epimerase